MEANQLSLFTAEEKDKIFAEFAEQRGCYVKSVKKKGFTLLDCAAALGKFEVVKFLVATEENVYVKTNNFHTSLQLAVEEGKIEIVKYLVSMGADVNEDDWWSDETLLHKAAYLGNLELVAFLVSVGADVNKANGEGKTPLDVAVETKNMEVVKYLADIKDQKEINEYYETVAKRRRCNVQDVKKDLTLLHCAAALGKAELVKFLVLAGEDVNVKNTDSTTPLHYAAQSGNVEIVEYLVSQGAGIHTNNNYGNTPLYYAAYRGRNSVVQLLVSVKADTNAKTKGGRTPLHWAACRNRNIDVVKYLVFIGANIRARDYKGMTPLDIAKRWGDTELIECLENLEWGFGFGGTQYVDDF